MHTKCLGNTRFFFLVTGNDLILCSVDSDSENDTNDMDNQEQLVFNISDTENTFHIRSLFCDGSEKTIQACERKEAEDCYSLGGIRCRGIKVIYSD